MSDELRHRLENAGRDPVTPLRLDFVEKRARRLTMQTLVVATFSLAVLVAGAFAVRSAISTDAAPLPPAEGQENLVPGPMPNGPIIHSIRGSAGEDGDTTEPPQPGEKPYLVWGAFDQETGYFLYAPEGRYRYVVVDQDGVVAEFPCVYATAIVPCGSQAADGGIWETFGPGPDEISVPSDDLFYPDPSDNPSARFVQIMGFDGSVRDKLDVSAAIPQDQWLADLAWSPDGSRLALATEPNYECDPTTSRCESNVWIFDPATGESQLVFTERTPEEPVRGKYPNHPKLGKLAWSPDGRTVSFVEKAWFQEPGERVRPRLIALRMSPDQPVSAETLHVFGRTAESGNFTDRRNFDYYLTEGVEYSWSPDGTRIAVNSPDRITEISADDGTVLTQHPAEDLPTASFTSEKYRPVFLGPLAWLREQ